MKNNTTNNTVEFATNEEMSNYVSDAKQLPLSTIRKALADAQISYTSNAARPTYMQHMINTGVWTVAETVTPIQTEEKESEPMDNVHNESPANDANLTDTPANVAPIDTNSDLPIVQLAQIDELDEVLGSAPIDTNVPANESAPMSKSEALEFLKEYEAHANAYANAYLKASETFETLLNIGATEEKNRQLTVTGLVKASGITATNVDQYIAEKFAGKKIGKVAYTGIDTVLIARQIAESEYDRLARQIANFEFSFQPELDKLCAYLFSEVTVLTNGKVGIENITIDVKTGKVGIVNPIAPPATKRANKTAANTEGEEKGNKGEYCFETLKTVFSHEKKNVANKWSILSWRNYDQFSFTATNSEGEEKTFTNTTVGNETLTFNKAMNSAYKFVTSEGSAISIGKYFAPNYFVLGE
jgi:hypothetical protein